MSLQKIFHYFRRPLELNFFGLVCPESSGADRSFVSIRRLDPQEVQRVIDGHLSWCRLFNERLGADPDDGTEPLPDAQSSDLGRWLGQQSHGSALDHPLMMELVHENRHLHRTAQQALDFAHSQRLDLASTLLNREFERSRARILDILCRLYREVPGL